jgi:leucyl-tRNA synthetase
VPLTLPDTGNFKSSGNGEGPLANLKEWINFSENAKRDSNTMPTHAGAAWYFLRYMDPHNTKEFAGKSALDYWNQVDVYIGGSEHAVAHLLYSRLWTKILHDLGYLNFDEPFKKLINQGKITGDSRFVYRGDVKWFVSYELGEQEIPPQENPKFHPQFFFSERLFKELENNSNPELENKIKSQLKLLSEDFIKKGNAIKGEFRFTPHNDFVKRLTPIRIDINRVSGFELDTKAFKEWKPEFTNAEFILEDSDGNPTLDPDKGKYICGSAIEKMSKSYYNVINPDDIINSYGADTLRLYEMFLGPLEQSKPWITSGIDGVYKFLRRFWNLFHDNQGNWNVSNAEPTREELKVLHAALKKVEQDINNFSFNTSVSAFMICANELTSLKCNKRAVLEPLAIALSSFAPHITEELWEKLGHTDTIFNASFPKFDEQYLTESSFEYPISINGKVRAKMNFALDMPVSDMEKIVMASEAVQKWTEGKTPKKVIIVQGKIVNIVL